MVVFFLHLNFLGVFVHLLGFLFFHVVSNPLPPSEAIPPFVQYVSPGHYLSGAALEEQAARSS